MESALTLTLTAEEVQVIAQVLGQLPTNSGAWPLMQKILAQAREQNATARPA